MTEEEISVKLGEHSMTLKSLQHQIDEVKGITKELRVMNTSIVRLTDELRHTADSLSGYDERISGLESMRTKRMDFIVSSVITALASGVVGFLLSHILN